MPSVVEPFWRRREFALATILAVLVLGLTLVTGGRFAHPLNLRDLLVEASIPAVVAAGMTALIVAAQIDISVGATLAVCAVVIALLANRNVPAPLLVVAGLVLGAVLGAVNGALTAGLQIPSIVATLATLGALRGLLVLVSKGNTIPVPAPISALGTARLFGEVTQGFVLVCVAALVCAGMGLYLARTRPGRQHYAVGSNPRSAELSAVPVRWVVFRSFVLLGALVGLAAFLYVARYSTINPRPMPGFELVVITAVVVGGTDIFGGRGTVVGTVIASLLLVTINTGLDYVRAWLKERFGFDLPSEVQPAVQGLLILGAVLYNSLSRKEE